MSQGLCWDGYKEGGKSCCWKHVIIPAALAATTEAGLWGQVQELAGRELQGEAEYCRWLEQRHPKLVCRQEMTNAMAVFELVLRWRAKAGIRASGSGGGGSKGGAVYSRAAERLRADIP